jgi:hypothetical protein
MRKEQQKGGSVASNAVTGLVNQDTFSDMNKMFSNDVSGGQCGGSKSQTNTRLTKCSNCGVTYKAKLTTGGKISTHCKKGGMNILQDLANNIQSSLNIKSHFTNPFKSDPAPALNESLPLATGGAKTKSAKSAKCATSAKSKKSNMKGGEIKHLKEYMNSSKDDAYLLRNKRGGSVDNLGLNYDSVRAQTSVVGDMINRADQSVQNQIAATEAVVSSPLMQKTINFGAVTEGQQTNPMGFTFQGKSLTGGKKRPSVKKPKKKV